MVARRITRREFIKVAGSALLAAGVAGCAPASLSGLGETTPTGLSTVQVLPTRTLVPESTPAATASPQPAVTETEATATPESEPAPSSTGDGAADVLTPVQKERLYQASLGYVARTELEAIAVARRMAYVKNDRHPASMCGPLSVAILRDAGLINRYTNLHEFWLLTPRDHQAILQKTFPVDRFWWYRTEQSIASFDFKVFPLKAGDWLYIYAGNHDSFEHMLTVSRVDEVGRAYSVSNYETEDGYFIDELLLYDPTQPGAGQFYIWTDRKYAAIGLTGNGGFQLMRFNAPVPDPDPLTVTLALQIDQILAEAGGDWKILIKAVGSAEIYSRGSRDRLHAASVVKVPVAVLFFKSQEVQWGARAPTQSELTAALQKGAGGRSYQQLLQAMLVDSEEDATTILLEVIRQSRLDVQKTLAGWGAENIDLLQRRATAADLVLMAEKLYRGELLSTQSTRLLLQLLETYTPNDDRRLGVLHEYLPQGAHIYNKRGTLTDGLLVVADLAIVALPSGKCMDAGELSVAQAYTLGVFAYQSDTYFDAPQTTYERLDEAVAQLARAFGQYLEANL